MRNFSDVGAPRDHGSKDGRRSWRPGEFQPAALPSAHAGQGRFGRELQLRVAALNWKLCSCSRGTLCRTTARHELRTSKSRPQIKCADVCVPTTQVKRLGGQGAASQCGRTLSATRSCVPPIATGVDAHPSTFGTLDTTAHGCCGWRWLPFLRAPCGQVAVRILQNTTSCGLSVLHCQEFPPNGGGRPRRSAGAAAGGSAANPPSRDADAQARQPEGGSARLVVLALGLPGLLLHGDRRPQQALHGCPQRTVVVRVHALHRRPWSRRGGCTQQCRPGARWRCWHAALAPVPA
jgi:hypothetical protein